ncbi:MAG TPA: PmoA family protein [Bacteroidales bacterium]|nr:PmoA family protein [Bacteroidales bacterium]
MKLRILFFHLFAVLIILSCSKRSGEQDTKVSISTNQKERRADIVIDGKLFTSYCWPDDVYKPVLYPVFTASGTEITRGFPLKPRTGEQTDHIHQVGIWLNYGNVNGIDFWGNGYRGMKEPAGGEIQHVRIDRIESRKGEGILVTTSNWLVPGGKVILNERSEFHFSAKGNTRIIDRITKLTATDTTVLFKDTKEGFFAVRVARQLELPSKTGVNLIDSTGTPSTQKDTLNTGVTGNYLSSEGLQGESVWGTRAAWMDLYGIINDEKISVVICDHPKNPGFPTYWHARGYGLFSANPLGWKDFTQGKEEFNFKIKEKKSATFRYRVIISSGTYLSTEEINRLAADFGKRYK